MKTKLLLCGICVFSAVSAFAQSWFQIPTNTDKKLNTVSFPSSTIGYIGGNDSLLLKTTDGGHSWSEVDYSGVTFNQDMEHILNLQFVSENTGFMTVGPYTGNYKTVDGGLTWARLTPLDIVMCYNQGMYFFDENNGFVGGSGCFGGETIGKMSNGTWTQSAVEATMFADNYITDIDFLNTSFGLAVSRSGYVYRTTDGGAMWDSIPSLPGVMEPLTGVLIVNDTLAYASFDAVGVGFGLYVSIDGGLTWDVDMNSATFYYPDFYTLHQSGDDHIFTGGVSSNMYEGVIYEWPSGNEFMPWTYYSVDYSINDIASYDDSTVFAVGDSGYVIVNRDFDELGLKDQSFYDPATFSVYPNPSGGMLNIGTVLIPAKNARIRVYDVNGKLLRDAAYENTIDLSDLKNGLYVLELASGDNLQRTRFVKE